MSTIDTKQKIIKAISESYATAILKQQITATVRQDSEVNLACGDWNKTRITNDCELCLKQVIPEEIWKSDDATLKTAVQAAQAGDGLCHDICMCNASNLNISNQAQVHMVAHQITKDSQEMQVMVESIKKSLDKKYKLQAKDSDIVNIVTQVSAQAVKNINQVLFAYQALEVKGSGYNLNTIQPNIIINAIMVAVQSNESAVSIVDQLVREYVSKIKSDVDTHFTTGFSSIWNKTKGYFITLFVITLGILGVYAFLLVYLAIRRKKA